MKVCLLVQRKSGTTDVAWVIDAIDEYSMEGHPDGLTPAMKAKVDADPANVRTLWVTIPDGSLGLPFREPEVFGAVSATEDDLP